jgi:hypothetical protein
MVKWVIGKFILTGKFKMLKNEKPPFHYSIIPLFHVRDRNSGLIKILCP